MRKLLIIKRQKEFDEKIKKEDKNFCVYTEYSKFDQKDISILLNDKKLLLTYLLHINTIESFNLYSTFYNTSYYSLGMNKNIYKKSMIISYVDYIFEIKKIKNILLDVNLFIALSNLDVIKSLSKKYNIGKKLVSELESLTIIKELMKNVKVKSFLELKENNINSINNLLISNLKRTNKLRNKYKEMDLKKEFKILTIKNF